jgi:hypothetical protein
LQDYWYVVGSQPEELNQWMEADLTRKLATDFELSDRSPELQKLIYQSLPKLLVRATHGSAMGASMLRVGSLLDLDQQLSESLSIG